MANPRPVLLKIKTARPSTSRLTEKQAQRRRGYRYSKCSGLTAGAKHAPSVDTVQIGAGQDHFTLVFSTYQISNHLGAGHRPNQLRRARELR